MSTARSSVRVTDIAEYIRYQSCDRRFKLKFNNYELAKTIPFYELIFATSLDPVLEEEGRRRENEWEKSLQKDGLLDLTQMSQKSDKDKATDWNDFVTRIQNLKAEQTAYGREISLTGNIGEFNISGQIDFVVVLWENNQPKLRLVESKASRKDRTYHRVQVALYRMLVRQLIEDSQITINGIKLKSENIECVVVRIDENTNKSQDILQSETLNLDTVEADINRLIASDGALTRIVETDLADLDYQLDQKCSDCTLSVHCLAESARERRLELLGIDSSIVTVLHQAGVKTIDDLADFNLTGSQVAVIQQDISFTENLELLKLKAKTRRRTLPGGDADPNTYEVQQLPQYSGQSQLPEHSINGERLIRIYLSVEYDYVENRIGALAAHISKSEGKLDPKFDKNEDGKWQPDPKIKEYIEEGHDENNKPIYIEKELEGTDVIKFKTSAWAGDYKEDNGSEKELIQGFLLELVDAIAEVAKTEKAPIHFYVWSRQEMTQLVEGCSRVSSQLLSHLRELLGCRESLEQLIYSCLYDEVDRRYALGWTGRDLAVVTSLKWFGRRYHWRRKIAGQLVNLDEIFSQDVFDFKNNLEIDSNNQWATSNFENVCKHQFEVRLRYFNSLSAAYWRAYWRKLPNPNDPTLKPKLKNSIERYNKAQKPNYLKEYFRARTHAIRWVEEGIKFKNPDITKESLTIADLPDFNLGVDDAAQAGIDFLRLDQHVKVTDWIASHLVPPIYRVSLGRTIPVKNVVLQANNRLAAEINLDQYNIPSEVLQANCTIDQGSFVRLSPSSDDSHQGQTINQLLYGGSTCVVKEINWDTKQIELSVIPGESKRYQLYSKSYKDVTQVFQKATLDESPSDFVAGRVDQKLQSSQGNHVCQWLAPQNAQIPPQSTPLDRDLEKYYNLLKSLPLSNSKKLDDKQIAAVIDGLKTRIQLLQGPPGTGKTETTAIATFMRILARRSAGDIVLITAHTHTAVDNLLLRLDSLLPILTQHTANSGLTRPTIQLSKVHSLAIQPTGGNIQDFEAKSCLRTVNQMRSNAVLVIGGTTSAILKMVDELNSKQTFLKKEPQGFQTTTLIVDEASMMVFPHFLALATLVRNDGEIMLAGDHRQLAPIVTHDWENEDRPPVVLYQPYVSAYQAIQNLKENSDIKVSDEAILRSALSFTFRLPPVIRELIARLYRLDDIELQGKAKIEETEGNQAIDGTWEKLLQGNSGLYLVLHSERQSRRSNPVEVEIIKQILDAGGEISDGSVAIVTPHRAQRTLLKTELTDYYEKAVDVIDTVEKLQGGERPNVIVSATASDPSAISKNVEFILNLNRSNVAFSRVQERLIVVCSKTLLDYIPKELENYEETMLWKALRSKCSQLIFTENVNGHIVEVFTPPLDEISEI